MPGTSEATNDSPSPTPITTGGPKRAATILSGSAADSTPSAKAPVSRFTARRTATSSAMGSPAASASFCTCSIRCAMISVSVSVTNLCPCFGEFVLQLKIVFDNPVVNHDDASRAIAMRMRVLFRRPPMRCPARVPDAERALQRMLAQHLLQVGKLPRSAPHLKLLARWAAHGNPRRIVAPVFEAP